MQYNEAKRLAATCQKCKLCSNRYQMVWCKGYFVEGAPLGSPRYMFIGDAPSAKDSQVAVPFSDLVLEGLIKEAGIDSWYLTNTVKCPTPNGRAPFDTEMDDCFDYLEAQISDVDPDAIILLGKSANDLLWPEDNYGSLRNIVGMITDTGGRTYMPAYHTKFMDRQTKFIKKSMQDEFILNLQELKDYVEVETGMDEELFNELEGNLKETVKMAPILEVVEETLKGLKEVESE